MNEIFKINKTSSINKDARYKGASFQQLSEEKIKEISERFNLSKNQEIIRQQQISQLKHQLASTDYQIIKCYEYYLVGLELPYEVEPLHKEREYLREQIRELEIS